MDWITGLQNAIDYVEKHLTEPIDYDEVAKRCYCSSYHFQRVFSILCGYTLGEYIRCRRLSLAAAELASTDAKVLDVALKYGYDSADGFARAFLKFHGVLPRDVRTNGQNLKSFSRLVLTLSLKGGCMMNYRIENKPALALVGHKQICTGSPTNPDNAYSETRRHWLTSREAQRTMKTLRGEQPIWYDVYTDFEGDTFSHIIAVETDQSERDEVFDTVVIPAHTYAVFETESCESPDDHWLPMMTEIISQWLPTTEYTLADHPICNQLYYDPDPAKRYMEIWLPIEKVK